MIDIKEFNIPRHILEILLKDKTTGQNILWGGMERFDGQPEELSLF